MSRKTRPVTNGAALVLVLLAACVHAGDGLGEDDARRAQEEAGITLYWAGESFEALPLTASQVDGPGRALFVYGECDGESEGIDGFHCTKPQLQVQHFPFDAVGWEIASGCRSLDSLRGVPTLRHDGLVLVTGDGIVKVYATNAAQDRRLARALRPVGGPRVARLPAPSVAQRMVVSEACP
jgi:hypothetical protein